MLLGSRSDRAQVGLRDDHHIGDLHDARLVELQHVTGARRHHHGDGVRRVGDLRLGLADAQATEAGEAGDAQAGDAQAGASAILGDASPEQVCAELVQAGIGVRGFAVVSPSLEDLFVGLTGVGFDVSG